MHNVVRIQRPDSALSYTNLNQAVLGGVITLYICVRPCVARAELMPRMQNRCCFPNVFLLSFKLFLLGSVLILVNKTGRQDFSEGRLEQHFCIFRFVCVCVCEYAESLSYKWEKSFFFF